MIVVRFEMVFELLVEYGEHGSSSVAQLPNVILHFLINQHFPQNKPIQVLTTIKSVLLKFLFSARKFSHNQISELFRHVYMSINSKSPQESNKIKFLWQGLKTQFRSPFAYS